MKCLSLVSIPLQMCTNCTPKLSSISETVRGSIYIPIPTSKLPTPILHHPSKNIFWIWSQIIPLQSPIRLEQSSPLPQICHLSWPLQNFPVLTPQNNLFMLLIMCGRLGTNLHSDYCTATVLPLTPVFNSLYCTPNVLISTDCWGG